MGFHHPPRRLYNYIYQEEDSRRESLWTDRAQATPTSRNAEPASTRRMFRETRRSTRCRPTSRSMASLEDDPSKKFEFDVPVNEKETWFVRGLDSNTTSRSSEAKRQPGRLSGPSADMGSNRACHSAGRTRFSKAEAVTAMREVGAAISSQVCPAASDQVLASGRSNMISTAAPGVHNTRNARSQELAGGSPALAARGRPSGRCSAPCGVPSRTSSRTQAGTRRGRQQGASSFVVLALQATFESRKPKRVSCSASATPSRRATAASKCIRRRHSRTACTRGSSLRRLR
jgi:hypothetical protein